MIYANGELMNVRYVLKNNNELRVGYNLLAEGKKKREGHVHAALI